MANYDRKTGQPDTFLRSIEGSRGTVVLGNGLDALQGEVVRAGHDYIELEKHEAHWKHDSIVRIYVIPLHAISYYRFADEEE